MSQIFGVAMLLYLGVAIMFVMAELWSSPRGQQGARGLLWLGLAFQTGALLGRWLSSYQMAAGHTPPAGFLEKLSLVIMQAPLSNRYESLVFFAWSLPAVGLIAFRKNLQGWLGAVITLLACLLLAYASFGGADAHIQPLMPALQSNWLLIHVMTAFLGYASFGVGFGAALLYLVHESWPGTRLLALPLLDRLLYRATMLGFLLLTLGILTARCGPKVPGAVTGAGTPRRPGP